MRVNVASCKCQSPSPVAHQNCGQCESVRYSCCWSALSSMIKISPRRAGCLCTYFGLVQCKYVRLLVGWKHGRGWFLCLCQSWKVRGQTRNTKLVPPSTSMSSFSAGKSFRIIIDVFTNVKLMGASSSCISISVTRMFGSRFGNGTSMRKDRLRLNRRIQTTEI